MTVAIGFATFAFFFLSTNKEILEKQKSRSGYNDVGNDLLSSHI